MARKKIDWKKYVLIALMAFIAIGFMLPGALYFGSEAGSDSDYGNGENDKICRFDTDCYLQCDDGLKTVMCNQNLCDINSCEQYQLFEYDPAGNSVEIKITIDGDELDLEDYLLFTYDENFFVEFLGFDVTVHTTGLTLNNVLERIGMSLDSNCLNIGEESYCRSNEFELTLNVNDEENFYYGDYTLTKGDIVEIIYE